MIADRHEGKLGDSRWRSRLAGDEKVAESIHQLFRISVNRFLQLSSMRLLNLNQFNPLGGKQLNLL